MAPSNGGDVAVCMTGDLKKKEHGPCSPGATACLFRGWGATGGVKAMSASTVRRILRQEGLPGKAKDQAHGCVVAFLREGYIVRKHPGPMRFGCFECCDCGNRDILSTVKRIVRARLHLDHCEMPVGGHSGDDGVRLSTHANVIGEDGISHAALGSLCEPNYPSPEATEVVPAYSLQGPWMRHDLEHFDSDCRDQLQPVSLSAGALDGVGSGSYCELDGAALGPDLELYHPSPLKPDLMIRVEWFDLEHYDQAELAGADADALGPDLEPYYPISVEPDPMIMRWPEADRASRSLLRAPAVPSQDRSSRRSTGTQELDNHTERRNDKSAEAVAGERRKPRVRSCRVDCHGQWEALPAQRTFPPIRACGREHAGEEFARAGESLHGPLCCLSKPLGFRSSQPACRALPLGV